MSAPKPWELAATTDIPPKEVLKAHQDASRAYHRAYYLERIKRLRACPNNPKGFVKHLCQECRLRPLRK